MPLLLLPLLLPMPSPPLLVSLVSPPSGKLEFELLPPLVDAESLGLLVLWGYCRLVGGGGGTVGGDARTAVPLPWCDVLKTGGAWETTA